MLAAGPVISEFMASNAETILDEFGASSDWIEVQNQGDSSVDLGGWHLTDDPREPDKWTFPAYHLEGGGSMLVFASGDSKVVTQVDLKSDFVSLVDNTFLVDLPDGDYQVQLLVGDATRSRDDIDIYVQHTLVDTLANNPGEFLSRVFPAAVTSATEGRLAVRMRDTGGATGKAVLNALMITSASGGDPLRFDFGPPGSRVEPGHTPVSAADVYDPATGYGWQSNETLGGQVHHVSLHTDFKLRAAGEYLALVAPDGTVVSEFGQGGADYPPQRTDVSYGRTPDGIRFFPEPTPGSENTAGVIDFLEPVTFSAERGFYDAPFVLQIDTGTPDATVRYTLDGTPPLRDHGQILSGPLSISGTTNLRAAAFQDGYASSPIATHTYLFPQDVLLQSESFGKDGTGLPPFPPWGHANENGDWEVDPDVVHHPDPNNRLTADDLLSIPTMSLVLPWDGMFSNAEGIYIRGDGIPRAASLEQILPDGSTGFQIDSSVQIQGGSSTRRWKADKLSMRVKFVEPFGPTKLDYPLFGNEAADRFDTIILDAVLNHSWHIPEPDALNSAKFIQDQFVADLQNATGGWAPHARFHHLYINGLYWGLYYVHERPDESFAADYLGGDKDDYDVVKHSSSEVVSGTASNYQHMLNMARQDLSQDAHYEQLKSVLDIDDFISYMLVNFYVANTDWARHNWYASFNRKDSQGKWRFHSWDAEIVLNNVQIDVTSENNIGAPTEIHRRLLVNDEYRLRFADLAHKYLFNGGALTAENAAGTYQRLMDEVDQAIRGESARWGDNKREAPFTRSDWLSTQQNVLKDFFPRRRPILLEQLQAWDLYPAVDAPEFGQHGGPISVASSIGLHAPEGHIYYTLDGSDPRLPGGALSASGRLFVDSFQIEQDTVVKARVLHEGVWSAVTEAGFEAISDFPLRISEINFDPHGPNPVGGLDEANVDSQQFEFVELVNTSNDPIPLGGVRFVHTDGDGGRQGIDFNLSDQTLPPGQRTVIVRDRNAFQSRYGDAVPIAAGNDGQGGLEGEFSGELNHRQGRLTLVDAAGRVIQRFAFPGDDVWPARARGLGSTLEIVDPLGDYQNPTMWRATSEFGGSPGAEGRGQDGRIVINEVMTDSFSPSPAGSLELLNRSESDVPIGGWYISNSSNDFFRYRIPSETTLAEGQYVVYNQAQLGFQWDAPFNELWLLAANDQGRPERFVDYVAFVGGRAGDALGRWPDGDASAVLFPMRTATLGAENSGPATGDVVVSEILDRVPALETFEHSFDNGSTAGFTPRLGTWSVKEDGRYTVIPGPEGDTVSLLTGGLDPQPRNVRFATSLRIEWLTEFSRNGAIIFDYRGAEDFKFASVHVVAGKWRVGQRTPEGWQFLAELAEPITPLLIRDGQLAVALEIRGTTASLLHKGAVKVSHDFGESLGGGALGLGSKNGQALFDDVVVESLMESDDFRFIELINTTQADQQLDGWQLAGSVHMEFPDGVTLQPGEKLLAVPFDPSDRSLADDFRARMQADAAVTLVGPFAGSLTEPDAVVQILKAVGSDDPQPRLVLEDRVPVARLVVPRNQFVAGASIHRRTVEAFGDFSESWIAGLPSPGHAVFPGPGDLNANGTIELDDATAFVLALKSSRKYEQEFHAPVALAGDTDRDGDVDFDDIARFLAMLPGEAAASTLASDDGYPRRVNSEETWPRLVDHAMSSSPGLVVHHKTRDPEAFRS